MFELQSIWGWQPALYLFLGGLGAGAFLVAGLMALKDFEAHKRTVSISMWSATACLIVGLLLLVSELSAPLRGLMMWQSFSNFSSWMAIGAWILLASVIVFVLASILACDKTFGIVEKVPAIAKSRTAALKALSILGICLGLGVAVYTGILLMSAPGVPLWNTALIPCLFTVSALDTGIALVEVVDAFAQKDEAASRASRKRAEIAVMCLVALECAILFALAQAMLGGNATGATANESSVSAAIASIQILLTGELSLPFWGLVVGLGLALPFLAAFMGLFLGGKSGKVAGVVGAAGALIGGCALRFVILAAGLHADIVLDAVSRIIFY